jgi:integrase
VEEAVDEKDRAGRLSSSFLAYVDDQGHYADFHALRKTFITNLSRVGVAPKTAQILARHSDINLTMKTYTMLGVLDQVGAVEALPAVPEIKSRDGLRAAG